MYFGTVVLKNNVVLLLLFNPLVVDFLRAESVDVLSIQLANVLLSSPIKGSGEMWIILFHPIIYKYAKEWAALMKYDSSSFISKSLPILCMEHFYHFLLAFLNCYPPSLLLWSLCHNPVGYSTYSNLQEFHSPTNFLRNPNILSSDSYHSSVEFRIQIL